MAAVAIILPWRSNGVPQGLILDVSLLPCSLSDSGDPGVAQAGRDDRLRLLPSGQADFTQGHLRCLGDLDSHEKSLSVVAPLATTSSEFQICNHWRVEGGLLVLSKDGWPT